jgi:4-hydroxybenzoate polyprenyltransferase
VFLGSAVLLAANLWVIAVILATIPAALGTMMFYGRTKAAWYSPVVATMASSSFVAWAWLVGGARYPAAFALLFATASLHGVHANLRSQLRDIEGDPKAGTVTLAARLGPKRTLMIAAAARLVELVAIAVSAFAYGVPAGAVWLVPALILFVVALSRAPEFYARTRDRRQQTDEMMIWVHLSFITELAAFGAFRPLTALALGAGMAIWFRIVRAGY